MSVRLREVQRRMRATRRIRQVTSAMQRVSSARLVHDRRAMEYSRRYTERLTELVRVLAAAGDDVAHPFLAPGPLPGGAVLLLVFGSDRGLCGGYNRALLDAVLRFRREHLGARAPCSVLAVGRIAARRLARAAFRVETVYPQPSRAARAETLDRLTARAVDAFTRKRCAEVVLVFTRFESALRRIVTTARVLPLAGDGPPSRAFRAALFEPPAPLMLQRLLPEYVRQAVDAAFLNALASEHAARQEAMTRASENAGDLLRDLNRRYSRLRQES
ncbi:MAG: F0F1 ATP synthase subunit gamma, partial [Lentisphaerae bacterium]|nr:F0F1 ATP synthase subunit gamma [Lentisphaerota bacterium]